MIQILEQGTDPLIIKDITLDNCLQFPCIPQTDLSQGNNTFVDLKSSPQLSPSLITIATKVLFSIAHSCHTLQKKEYHEVKES